MSVNDQAGSSSLVASVPSLGPDGQACRSRASRPRSSRGFAVAGPSGQGPVGQEKGWGPSNPRWYRQNPGRGRSAPTVSAACYKEGGVASPSLSHGAASGSCARDSVDQEAAQPRVSVPGFSSVPAPGDRAAEQRHRQAVVQHPSRPSCDVSTPKRRRREDSRWQRNSQESCGDEPPGGLLHDVWHGAAPPVGATEPPQQARRGTGRGSKGDKKEKTKKEKKGKKDKREGL